MAETTLPKLLVSREEAYQKIQAQIEKGQQLHARQIDSYDGLEEARTESKKWSKYNQVLLARLFDNTSIMENEYINFFESRPEPRLTRLSAYAPSFEDYLRNYRKGMVSSINSLEGICDRLELYDEPSEMLQRTSGNKEVSDSSQSTFGDEVFIVHGHNDEAKEAVARFVENLDIEATILHEQANRGQTIPEKFEEHADDAGFAIILLTLDDVGASKNEQDNLKPRARQNVVLELGYFWRGLGRERMCVLYKEGVELPSDIHGILYVPMDSSNGWQLQLAKEMKQAGLPVDLNRLA